MRKPAFVPPYKYERETKAKYAERTEWLRNLWEALRPGDTITTVLRHRSSSGMYRAIDLYLLGCDEEGRPTRQWLSYWTAHAGVGRWDERREAVGTSGAGMDMGFHLVYTLSHMLFPKGFDCIGKNCPANDHSNQWGAYANGHCFICGADLPDFVRGSHGLFEKNVAPQTSSPFTRDGLAVWPEACVTARRHHNSGGYALRHEWLG
jgi:hypothetical protein